MRGTAWLAFFALVVAVHTAFFTASSVVRDVDRTTLDGWQVCWEDNFAFSGPSFAELLAGCGPDIAVSCGPAGDNTLKLFAEGTAALTFAVAPLTHTEGNVSWYHENENYLGFRDTVASNGTFATTCSTGVGDDFLCLELNTGGGPSNIIATGGYCGNLGAAVIGSAERTVWHRPCGGLANGTDCTAANRNPCAASAECLGETCVVTAPTNLTSFESPCTIASCSRFGNISVANAVNGTPCDTLPCVDFMSCLEVGGVAQCQGGLPRVCTPSATVCNVTLGCSNSSNSCEYAPAPNGTLCSDLPLSFVNQRCELGVCVGDPKTCPPPGVCRMPATVNAITGVCEYPLVTSGPCTPPSPDVCQLSYACNGVGDCVSTGPAPPPPITECSAVAANATCVPFVGYSVVNQPDFTACTVAPPDVCAETLGCINGACVATKRRSCDSGTQCAVPAPCDPVSGCPTPTARPGPAAPCVTDVCSIDSVCVGTTCVAGTPLDCSLIFDAACALGIGCNVSASGAPTPCTAAFFQPANTPCSGGLCDGAGLCVPLTGTTASTTGTSAAANAHPLLALLL